MDSNVAPRTGGNIDAMPAGIVRDDRVFPEVRAIAIFIVLVLIIASYMLYGLPEQVGSAQPIFAWKINPTMTSMLMGAGYLGGAWFFIRAFFAKKWHYFGNGFLAISTFVWFMGFSTLLHFDKFAPYSSFSFYAWLILYIVTPFLVPFLWWRNRQTDPGTPDPDDVVVPATFRQADRAVGLILIAIAALIFIFGPWVAAKTAANPDGLDLWPWALTPLTARVMGGWFALPGIVGLVLSREPRWSGWRIMIESQMISLVLILLAAVRAWNEFKQDSPLTWFFVIGMSLLLLTVAGLYVMMEMRRRQARATVPA